MTPLKFVETWRPVALTERAAAQSHFIDLCRLFDHPTPIEDDPKGERFTFEKGVTKSGGGNGFADVWKRGFFAWEYKKKKRNLDDALGQLARYALALENPPLHVVCDTDRFRIVTACTNSLPKSYDLTLDDLLDSKKRELLEAVFWHPEKLRPGITRSELTKEVADKFFTLCQHLQAKGHGAETVGHFVNQLAFLLFIEDVGIIENNYFRRVIGEIAAKPREAKEILTSLFKTFRSGGRFGLDKLPWINGGMFDGQEALELDAHGIGLLKAASSQNLAHIDPSIFGTLFERLIDPNKRSQIGAHYTDAETIRRIVVPSLVEPLMKEWHLARADIENLISKIRATSRTSKNWQLAEDRRSKYIERLRNLSILDPACGSGNFLYVALREVKNIEHLVNQECEALGLEPRIPLVGPEILKGIEINPLAADLARTSIWIGDIQWGVENGFHARPEPIIRKFDNIQRRDALLTEIMDEAKWPDAEFIIGNPPFLGDKKMQGALGTSYVKRLREVYGSRVSGNMDLVCHWFLKTVEAMDRGTTAYAGLVAPNSIRRGANRKVLDRLTSTSTLFNAWSDQPWVSDGAALRVSMACFSTKPQPESKLDGQIVSRIHSDLTSGSFDITSAKKLRQNTRVAYLGVQKSGPFDVLGALARRWIKLPSNPNGKKNSEVLRPYRNGDDVTNRPRDAWLIDFPLNMRMKDVSLFEAPFEYLKNARYSNNPEDTCSLEEARAEARDSHAQERWWEPYWPRPEMRKKITKLSRYLVTPETPTHTVFAWLSSAIVPDKNLIVITKDDSTTFGVLQSKYHLLWVRALGSPYGNHPTARRYNSSRVFETFPFPEGMTPDLCASAYASDDGAQRVADAADNLDRLRHRWLQPPELLKAQAEVVKGYPDRMLPIDAEAEIILRSRTLTNLYNEKPSWLDNAHRELDAAVAACYSWSDNLPDSGAIEKLLSLNAVRSTMRSN